MKFVPGRCVSIAGKGVLLLGVRGSGKSDLCLRLIDGGATLVGDDQLEIERRGDDVFAQAPDKLAGLLEGHGLGILKNVDSVSEIKLEIVVSLDAQENIERLPEAETYHLLGASLLHIKLNAFAPSTCAKIRAILRYDSLAQDQLL